MDKTEKLMMEMHGKIESIDERTKGQEKQLTSIFGMMNNSGCATGKQNSTAIKWLWTVICLGGIAIFAVIGFFHLS